MTDPSAASSGLVVAMVDEWFRAGVSVAFVSPGSRSTPLALAVADRLQVHVVLDERSAAFHALGYGKVTGRPAVLVCTSGTAAANYYPAVKEADLSGVPLLVCTADRPPELRDTGAPQAMDQQALYGSAVRWYVDPGVPTDHSGAGKYWRSIGARAVQEAAGSDPGPVHVNLPFREPFLSNDDPVEYPGRPGDAPWISYSEAERPRADPATTTAFIERIRDTERGLLLLGQDPAVDFGTVARFEAATGWPVLADPLSGMRTVDTITTYDALARCNEWISAHRPEVVVRLGRPLTSKALGIALGADVHQITVAPRRMHLDPYRTAASTIVAEPRWLLANAAENVHRGAHDWMAEWMVAEGRARRAIDDVLDAADGLTEPRIARDVVAAAPEGSQVLLGSSMPVRDVESFAAGRHDVRIASNRGANGIDGMVSTAIGMAIGSGRATVALIGDIGFLHDTNGLLMAAERDVDVTLVVVDNDGGGIFSFLPQAGHGRFEQLFGTPHGSDVAAIAAAHGLAVVAPEEPDLVGPVVASSVAAGGVRFVHLETDRNGNVAVHRRVWDAVRSAVEPS
jgi:2-succinyl-5-enolpyruvyl-6-hydroxy-3-cyclohexene-1-carboxylate synthase